MALHLKKNIEACVEDVSAHDEDQSDDQLNEEMAAFADFQMPQQPQRKRDWKQLSKQLSARIDNKLDS